MKIHNGNFTEADYTTLCATPLDKLSDYDLLQCLVFNTDASYARTFAIELLSRPRREQFEQAKESKALEALKVLKEFLK